VLKSIKKGIFSVAIDDAPHTRNSNVTSLIFVFCRGIYLENVIKRNIDVDGIDATDVIIKTLKPLLNSFNLILTHGITFGGFNVINIQKISTELNKPIIAITENTPKGDEFLNALKNVPYNNLKEEFVKNAGSIENCFIKSIKNPVYFYYKNIDLEFVKLFIKKFSIRSKLPEQLLISHKIASMFSE